VGSNWQLVFENISGFGNSLYVDNILIAESTPCFADPHIVINDCGIEIIKDPVDGNWVIVGEFQDYLVEILDASGSVVHTIEASGVRKISTSQLVTGLHFLSIKDVNNGLLALEKIIKT